MCLINNVDLEEKCSTLQENNVLETLRKLACEEVSSVLKSGRK
jgi:hypothetical protein